MPFGRKTVLVILLVLSILFLVLLGWQQIKGGERKSLTAQLLDLSRRQPDAVIDLNNEQPIADTSVINSPKSPQISFCDFNATGKPTFSSLIIINEVAWMGTPENSLAEWIELKNTSNQTLNVSGYQLIDQAGQIQINLPAVSLPAGNFFLLVRENTNGQFVNLADLPYKGALSNTDETLKLFDNRCVLLDAVSAEPNWPAGDNQTKQTMERTPDLNWQTSFVIGGTPKKENSFIVQQEEKKEEPKLETPVQNNPEPVVQNNNVEEPTPPPVEQKQISNILITEIMAGKTDNAAYEFVELYNPNDTTVDLTGWTVKKKSSTGSETLLVAASRLEGKNILSRRYFLLASEGGCDGAVQPDVWWPKSYILAYTNNSVLIYDADGQVTAELTWSKIPPDQSWSRGAAGAGEFSIQTSPNPQNSQSF